jgi:hypothetical protein
MSDCPAVIINETPNIVSVVQNNIGIFTTEQINVLESCGGDIQLLTIAMQGIQGIPGAQGAPGVGVPIGGTTNEVLAKNSFTDYDTKWLALAAVAFSGSYEDITGAPTALSAFTNDVGFITSSALDPYLSSSAAASTYQPIGSYLTDISGLLAEGSNITITGAGTAVSPYTISSSGGGGTPGGSLTQLQFYDTGTVFGGANVYYDKLFQRLGIQVSTPLLPFHVDSTVQQTIAAPSAITPTLTLDSTVDAPTSASAAMVTIALGDSAGLNYSQTDDPSYLYTANGSTSINATITPYKVIQGTQYASGVSTPITVSDNSDGQQCGFGYNWGTVDADGYWLQSSGSATGGNPNWTKDVGNVTSFFDDGTISASDPAPTAFSAICFPQISTSYADPNSGSGSFSSDGSGQIANGSDWQVWIYGYTPIHGTNYFTSAPYQIDLGADPNDGNPYAATGSFSGGSYPNYVAILYIGGSPVAGQDLGGGTSFYITNGSIPGVSPAISGYTGTTWSYGAYGKVVSPSVKYSISNYSYSVSDTNPVGGFIFIHSLSGFGDATDTKIIESTPTDRGTGYIYEGATANTVYQYNQALGDDVVTPSTIGFQATGQTVDYDFYSVGSIYGTTVYSTATTAPVVYPNDSLYYTVSFAGTLPSSATLRVNKVGTGWKDFSSFSAVQDDTTVSWSGSGTVTPTGAYIPTARVDWNSDNLGSSAVPSIIFDHSNALHARMVCAAYYNGVGQYQAAWGYSANQNFAMDSYNHGLEVGALGSPDFILQPTSAKFNIKGNSGLFTYFYGSGSGIPAILTMNPNVNTIYFGNASLNYDPFSAVAIQPYSTDTGLTFYPNPSVSTNYLQWAVNNSSNSILAACDGNGHISVGRGLTGTARFDVASGNSTYGQVRFQNTTTLQSSPASGVLTFTNTLDEANGGLYLWDGALNRRKLVMALPTGTNGQYWRSDSLGNPIADNSLSSNGSNQVFVGSAYNFAMTGGASINSGKDLTMGNTSRFLGAFRPNIASVSASTTLNAANNSPFTEFIGSTSGRTLTLPTAASTGGIWYNVFNRATVSVGMATTSSQSMNYGTGTVTSLTVQPGDLVFNFATNSNTWDTFLCQYIATTDRGGTGATSLAAAGLFVPVTADFAGQTATKSSVVTLTTPNDATNHQYKIGAYADITAISAGTLTLTCTFTDENSASRTLTFYGMGLTSAGVTTTGFTPFPDATIRAKANTAITLVSTFSGVSITYDVGGNITRAN